MPAHARQFIPLLPEAEAEKHILNATTSRSNGTDRISLSYALNICPLVVRRRSKKSFSPEVSSLHPTAYHGHCSDKLGSGAKLPLRSKRRACNRTIADRNRLLAMLPLVPNTCPLIFFARSNSSCLAWRKDRNLAAQSGRKPLSRSVYNLRDATGLSCACP